MAFRLSQGTDTGAEGGGTDWVIRTQGSLTMTLQSANKKKKKAKCGKGEKK